MKVSKKKELISFARKHHLKRGPQVNHTRFDVLANELAQVREQLPKHLRDGKNRIRVSWPALLPLMLTQFGHCW